MSLFDIFRRKPERKLLQTTPIRAGVPISTYDRENDAYFSNAADKSVDAFCSDGERRKLRARCRKVLMDSPWAMNLARSLSLSTYGPGPSLQVRTDNPELNTAIENEFNRWRKAVNYDTQFLTAIQSLPSDGEAFFHVFENPHIGNGVGLELIEPYRIESRVAEGLSPNEFCGVTYDEFNRPVTYSVRDTDPNPHSITYSYTELPAANIQHLFIPLLPAQKRGLPLLQTALTTLSYLRTLEDATLAGAQSAANVSFVIQSKLDPSIEQAETANHIVAGADFSAFDEISLPLTKNTGVYLPDGFTASQFHAEQPNLNLVAYQESCLLGVGASVGAPKNISLNDSSSYNYSSARLDAQLFERWSGVLQSLCEPILSAHLKLVLLSSNNATIKEYLTVHGSFNSIPHSWFFKSMTHIDRKHEADCDALLVEKNMLSLRDYYAKQGKDWVEELNQIKKERELLASMNLTTADVKI